MIHFSSAAQIIPALQDGSLSAAELIEGQLGRIARHNPAINAIVTLDEPGARQAAAAADKARARGESLGPLHGLPITIKDAFAVAGLRSTCSYPPLKDHIPTADARAVARLRRAGAIILGKTNLPPLASDFQTVSPLFGRTNNPWDLTRTPGGSTGGGAAAVAAGLSFLELGSDLAGSLRIPAHFCGVCSFAPTGDRVPRDGHLPRQAPGGFLGRFLRVGLLARSVADLELAFPLIAGPDPAEPDLPPVPLDRPAPHSLAGLRIAWTAEWGSVPVTAGTQAVLKALADCLAGQGCHLERLEPPGFDVALARQVHNLVFMSVIGASLPAVPRLLGRHLGGVRAFDLDLRSYLQAETQRAALAAALDAFLEDWDVWILPVTATPAFPHHSPSGFSGPTPVYRAPLRLDDREIDYYVANTAFTTPLNVTGHPVVTLPAGKSPEGLPIGVQVVGRRWRDMELLAIAGLLAGAIELTGHPDLE